VNLLIKTLIKEFHCVGRHFIFIFIIIWTCMDLSLF